MLRLIGRLTCSAVLMTFVTAAPSTAQPLDKRTYFTFSGAVAIPGVTLPAGEYLFRLANPDSGRNVVQVMNAAGTKPLGMFFAIRAERRDPSDKPEVSFMETAAGNPAAIRTWWYPGERSGFEFIYPKAQARQLAKGTNQPVLTTRAETTTAEQTDTTDLARISPAGQDVNVSPDSTQSAAAPSGRTQQGTIAQSNAPSSAQSNAQNARAALPRTASLTPMVALAGLIFLMAGAAIWLWPMRRV